MNNQPTDVFYNEQPLENILAGVPDSHISPQARNSLVSLFRRMDDLGRLDAQLRNVYIDEQGFHDLLKAYFQQEFVDQYMMTMKSFAGNILTVTSNNTPQRMSKIKWQTLTQHVRSQGQVPSNDIFEGLGLSMLSTTDDLRKAVQQHHPGIPGQLFDPKVLHNGLQEVANRLTVAAKGTSTSPHVVSDTILSDIWNKFTNCIASKWWGWFWVSVALFVIIVALAAFTAGTMVAVIVAAETAAAIAGISLTWNILSCILFSLGITINF